MDQHPELKPLKLKAFDDEDLLVLASLLQDAIVPLSGMKFDQDKGQFYLIANRFCWECQHHHEKDGSPYHRVQSGAHFEHVKNVQKRGLPEHPEGMVNLLTIHNTKDGCIHLAFSGGGQIKLEVETLHCRLQDLDEPYTTPNHPTHEQVFDKRA